MSTIVTRAGKGTPLTHAEVDTNFTNLNSDKYEEGNTLAAGLGAVGTPSYTFAGDLNTGLWSPAADAVAVSTNGVERLRVNDSGVGIGAASGTSSGYATAPQLLNYSASATNLLNASDTTSTIRSALYRDTSGGGIISISKFRGTYASPTAVQSGDTSGRLWFEVWGGSNLRRIAEVGALVDTYTSDTNISGALYFATSTSGNASSNEKMRLTAAGNLGIGTTIPGQKLDVIGSGRSTGAWAVGDSTGNFSGSMVNESDVSKSVTFNADPGNAGASSFMRFNVDGSERARIDSSGNLGIGTASWPSSQRLRVAGGDVGLEGQYLFLTNANANILLGASQNAQIINSDSGNLLTISRTGASSAMAFSTAGSERMRLDSSGNLGIGMASPGGYGGYTALAVNNSTNGGLIDLMTNGTRHLTLFAGATASMIGTASNTALQIQTNGTERMRITEVGNIVAGASAALATNATNGFLYVPTCAGTPTGTPTAITGMAPIVVDTTNNKLYFYSGGQWRDAGP